MEDANKKSNMAWVAEQYTKIQDFIIMNKMYLNCSDLSHADILILEVKRLQKKCQAYEAGMKALLSKLEK